MIDSRDPLRALPEPRPLPTEPGARRGRPKGRAGRPSATKDAEAIRRAQAAGERILAGPKPAPAAGKKPDAKKPDLPEEPTPEECRTAARMYQSLWDVIALALRMPELRVLDQELAPLGRPAALVVRKRFPHFALEPEAQLAMADAPHLRRSGWAAVKRFQDVQGTRRPAPVSPTGPAPPATPAPQPAAPPQRIVSADGEELRVIGKDIAPGPA